MAGGDGESAAANDAGEPTVENGTGQQAAENGAGEGVTERDAGEPVTDEDFVAAVTEICERTTDEALAAGLGEAFGPDDSEDPQALAAEILERFNKFEEILKPAFAELHEITPSAASSDDFAEFIATNERLMALGERTMDVYADDPNFTMSEADARLQQRLKQKQERLNRKLGLPENCFDNTPS